MEVLLAAELEERERKTIERRIHEAHLPRLKTLEELTAVSFGIERSDLDANPHVRVQDQLRLHRAANVATLGCVLLELAATCALVKISSRGTISRIKAGTRAALAFIGLGILSYLIVVAALMGLAWDPLLSVQRALAHWILAIVG